MSVLPPTSRIAIIGAGNAGLLTTNRLIKSGYKNVTIYDANDKCGGVWLKGYYGLTLQDPMKYYEIPDYPYFNDVTDTQRDIPCHVEGIQIQKYFEQYSIDNNFNHLIKFNNRINKLQFDNINKKWVINDNDKEESFDFIINCNGIYHIHKEIDELNIKNIDAFNGKIINSNNFTNINEYITDKNCNKNIVVIGGGKSCMEISTNISYYLYENYGVKQKCHMIDPHCYPLFPINDKFCDKIVYPKDFLLFSPSYDDYPGPDICDYKMSDEEFDAYSKTRDEKPEIHDFCDKVYRMDAPKEMQYDKHFSLMPYSAAALEPSKGYYDSVRYGLLKHYAKKKVDKLGNNNTVYLNDGTNIENVNLIINCCGWKIGFPYFDKEIENKLINPNDNYLRLYRKMYHWDIPQMLFNGFATTYGCTLTNFIGAGWISYLMQNKLMEKWNPYLMDKNKLINKVEKEINWKKEQNQNPNWIVPAAYFYNMELLQDMNLKRKVYNNSFYHDYTHSHERIEWADSIPYHTLNQYK